MNKTEYIIEKGILLNIPKRKTYMKYPFREMNIGDSFIFKEYTRTNMSLASNCARNWGKKQNPVKTFCVRKTDDNMIRIYRTK